MPAVKPRLKTLVGILTLVFALSILMTATAAIAEDLVVNGDFKGVKNSKALRKDSKGQDWYESRKDTKAGTDLLFLSKKKIYGNKTPKAMIKGSVEFNTYLSQPLSEAQTVNVSVQYDILIKDIVTEANGGHNRSGFFFLGGIKDKKGGPNSTGKERFVFLGFENAATEGKINLFAREGSTKYAERTIVARDLDLKTWYTIKVDANIPDGFYEVTIDGVTEAFELESFYYKGNTPEKVSHISFASWNDGAGTFYVDNVVVNND